MEKKCTELREKSKQKQEERRLIMTETKVLLKTKGEILTNYDKRKYQLLIEKDRVHHRLSHLSIGSIVVRRALTYFNSMKEQFVAANEVIKKQNSCCKNKIGTMKFSDRILANQIKQFTEGLRCLESNLSDAREDFVKFAAETKTRGTHLD